MKVRSLIVAITLSVATVPAAVWSAEEGCPAPADAAGALRWPSKAPRGSFDIVHFGEGHWNEGQGPMTMPLLVQDVKAFRPRLVAFSSDMADIGSPDRLGCFRSLMQPLVEADIPWFNSPGNHDRLAVAGPGGVANGAIDVWRNVFADMPAPWGDGKRAPGTVLPKNEPDDGDGAATHYYFDYGPVGHPVFRLIALDNSQHSFGSSDLDQYPAVGPGSTDPSQLAFLKRVADEATERGLLSLVLMHQPTQDPRDVRNVHPTSLNHTMGKGGSPDNALFDAIAATSGVDAVLMGHIQGNVVYGDTATRYYIDGGGGGTPYALSEVGTDTGYFYGFRILRFYRDGGSWAIRSYFVPLVDRIEIDGPERVAVGEEAALSATAVQPFDPDLPPRLGGAPNEAIRLEIRPPDDSRLDRASVPELAYVWKTSDSSILRPVPGALDDPEDPIFDERVMTTSGAFEALRPGIVTLTLVIGTRSSSVKVKVVAGDV